MHCRTQAAEIDLTALLAFTSFVHVAARRTPNKPVEPLRKAARGADAALKKHKGCEAMLSDKPDIHPSAEIENASLGPYTELKEGVRVLNASLGAYSYADRFADIAHAQIGKFVSIASFVRINPGDHPMERASQHHFTYRAPLYWPEATLDESVFARRAAAAVTIGHDVWIGHGAVVLSGRHVADGAVLGAGAVLTRDAGPYEIWAGAPARLIRPRHPAPVAEALRALAWWDWPYDRLREALEDFRRLSAEAFIEKHRDR